jgi:GTP-binding protein
VTSVELVVSAFSPEQFPRDGLPEIAFAGRSNVGKSSLLNALLLRGGRRGSTAAPADRRHLAHVSKTPGRTRALNFYRVDRAFYFVDLPGYGYAQVSRQAMAGWRKLAESFLSDRATLSLVVLIIDPRHGATPLDMQMKDWLIANDQRFLVVASKADKLTAAERFRCLRSIEQEFCSPLPFSAKTGEGVGPLWEAIRAALES